MFILQENNNISGYSNPELDMISKDIAELVRERQNMEQDIAQKEADIKIKNGEIKSLQSELDTLAATLKQLGNQKGEAQKRLNDLKAQVNNSSLMYRLMACLANVRCFLNTTICSCCLYIAFSKQFRSFTITIFNEYSNVIK